MTSGPATTPLLTLELRYEHDVVLARQRARQIAGLLGFDVHEQTRLATAVSELARNAYEYAGGGRVAFSLRREGSAGPEFHVRVSDQGPGIRDLDAILEGRYVSSTGMGLGILGAHRLAERFHIESEPGRGTTVEIGRTVPAARRIDGTDAARIGAALAMQAAQSPFEEIQRQNQELMQALEEVRTRQAQVERLNAELEETNRGVLALYAELDDRAQDLRRASEYKSRFLSDVSHELRTPLTSVLNLARLLLDRADGDLTTEQERQVGMIRRSVEMVTDLVNELLDLAKIEAGKTTLHHSEFTVDAFFASLRALARPLLDGDRVALQFEDETGNAVLHTDEKRLAQILRNFLSNAIKFTEAGSIRVVASWADDGRCVCIAVHDTGIGIARADLDRIFQDFVQLDGPIQRRVRGTGLGLPLTRKLGALLGGGVGVTSVVGEGSVFSVTIPRVHPDLAEPTDAEPGQ